MILEMLKLFFGLGSKPKKERRPTKDELMARFLAESVARSPYIKPESKPFVTERFLSDGDKRAYRIDKEDLTDAGLKRGARNSTIAVYMHARHRLGRLESLDRIRDADFKMFSLMASNDERDCSWCKSASGKKLPIDTDIDRLIQENCTCEYCRCTVIARRK